MYNIHREIISFQDIPAITEKSPKSVLLIRHSYRKSLQNGNPDPELTPEGWDYAVQCGIFLKGMKDVCFGSSPRRRTFQTIEGIIKGGELGNEESIIKPYPCLHDTAMFSPPEELMRTVEDHTLPQLLKTYYTTGKAPSMIDLPVFAENLASFLTTTEFEKKNVILASHDIILIALLTFYKVYPFREDDWCGYVQGAFFYQDQAGKWTIAYAVPDKDDRPKCKLFV